MESLFPTNNYYRFVEERYQLSNAEQVHSLMHVAIGVGLKYIIENIKTDAPGLKVNRVIKDELSHVVGISISSVDKYLGKMFQSNRPIDHSTLDKLSSQLFYCNKTANNDFFASGQSKYLQQKHIGILGKKEVQRESGQLINDLILFIKSKPHLIKLIGANLDSAKYPDLINHIFLKSPLSDAESSVFSTNTFKSDNPASLEISTIKSRAPMITALCVMLLGISLPIFILITGSIDLVIIIDYLIHDPGKHFFHIVIFPCMVWAFLRCFSVKNLLAQKQVFLLLISAGFLLSFGQTYSQHAQSICDLITNYYVCNDIVEQVFDSASLDMLFLLASSFLSFTASLFSIIVFACQLLELRSRGREICSALIYALINISFIVWAVARSYSEWHEVVLSFEESAINDFAIHRYRSFLLTLTMLVISQILILIQVAKKRKGILSFLSLFIAIDILSFWLVTNIHNIAFKFHTTSHFELNTVSSVSAILAPLIYCYFIAIMIIFSYATIVKNVTSNR